MQRWVFGGVVFFLAVVLAGCGGGGSAAPADSPVTVSTSQLFVTVKNVAGQPLTNVTIGVKPTGIQPEYQSFYRRLESEEERDISLGDFVGNDGTALNLRVVRPQYVHVVATDISGKEYDVELPWD